MNNINYRTRIIRGIVLFFLFFNVNNHLSAYLFTPKNLTTTKAPPLTPFLCDGKMYLSISSETSTSLYTLQIGNTVTFDLVGSSPIDYNGIAFRSTDQFIYAKGPYSHSLYQIGQGGLTNYVGQLEGLADGDWYIAADFTPEGHYVVTSNNGGDKLAMYDLSNSTPSLITINDKTYTEQISGVANFGDIAFHPATGLCYGYDHNTFKLCIIDPYTGEVNAFGNEQSSDINAIGALFFNAKGELFAYGRDDFFNIDLNTGEFTLVTNGPNSSTLDGCSCPYSLTFTKEVDSARDCSGETLTYTFEVINNSGKIQEGITFTDQLEEGLYFSSDPDDTFGGQIEGGSAIDQNRLAITGMSIPPGVSTFWVDVKVDKDYPDQRIANQATLSGFDSFLPFEIISDDPLTDLANDPTIINLSNDPIELSISFPDTITTINYGESILLSPIYNFEPDTFFWDGISLPDCELPCEELWVSPIEASEYTITAFNDLGCMATANIKVEVELFLDLYVPNAFSPNGDGINDLFTIHGKDDQFTVRDLQVFNRWGALIFQANNFSPKDDIGWNGTFKGATMNPGVFIWHAEVEFVDGSVENLSGDLTLVK